ncbi:hypothetical protein HON01_08085, partial [Candidatus Woesearchaeota archaeon]|nr:hypothetical protein [Candidatus Woesearchaeota archaeon]
LLLCCCSLVENSFAFSNLVGKIKNYVEHQDLEKFLRSKNLDGACKAESLNPCYTSRRLKGGEPARRGRSKIFDFTEKSLFTAV